MAKETRKAVALFETTRRLLSSLINEGLCTASIRADSSSSLRWICLRAQNPSTEGNGASVVVKVHLAPSASVKEDRGKIVSLVRPDQLLPPVMFESGKEDSHAPWGELDPGIIFETLYPWFGADREKSTLEIIKRELQNSAANQEAWLEFGEEQSPLDIGSPSIYWEKSLLWGHPTHPLHRTCYSQPPLKPVTPGDLREMLSPTIVFLSVPRSQVRVTGPYESTIQDLLSRLNIPGPSTDRVIIPALEQQQPSILSRFSDVLTVGSDLASAQASMRTISVRPELEFKYHLKLSLACQITSALRTITPWSAIGAPEVSELLVKLLPTDMWVYREVASVTGRQDDFNEAKHMSCILREDLEFKARAQGETLILAAALPQTTVRDGKTHAESIFDLNTPEQKLAWLKECVTTLAASILSGYNIVNTNNFSYTACLLRLTIPPLLKHGVGLEAHGQNIVARICTETRVIKGFAVRDFGGIRLHMPTLNSQGFHVDSIPDGSAITSHKLRDVWDKVHHSLFQNHLGLLIVNLQLEDKGGWALVREELKKILRPEDGKDARDLYNYFFRDMMFFKCFLRMKMEGKYRDYVKRHVPNVLIS